MYRLSMICAITGMLAFSDWLLARGVIQANPGNRFAQAFSEPWVLYAGLVLMSLGLLFAWISNRFGGRGQDEARGPLDTDGW